MPLTVMNGNTRHRQIGVSLIEVLVSVVVLGIGLLGIAALQATALRNGQSSIEQSHAVIQSYAMLDIIRADRENASLYTSSGMQCAAVAASGSAQTQAAQRRVNAWLAAVKQSVGSGIADTATCGSVNCVSIATGGATCTVEVQWNDARAREQGTATGSTTRKSVTVAIV